MNHAPKTNSKTSTGEVPRIEPLLMMESFERPHDLPEQPAPGSTTGIMPVVMLDAADPDKYADDNAKGYV